MCRDSAYCNCSLNHDKHLTTGQNVNNAAVRRRTGLLYGGLWPSCFIYIDVRSWLTLLWSVAVTTHWLTSLDIDEFWLRIINTLADMNAWRTWCWCRRIRINGLKFTFNRQCWYHRYSHRHFFWFASSGTRTSTTRTVPIGLSPVFLATLEADAAAGRRWSTSIDWHSVWQHVVGTRAIHSRWGRTTGWR